MMLTAYIDESGFDGRSPAYVVAGYVNSAAAWERFAEDWRLVLEMPPKIDYFKFDDALAFGGEFQHWSREARDAKIKLLNQVIGRYRPIGMTCSLKCEHFSNVATDPTAERILRSPYHYLLFSFVLQWMETQQSAFFNSDSGIRFVFDENAFWRTSIFESWKELRDSSYLPKRMRRLIAPDPIFGNDRDLTPLQAADMIAGICRRRWIEREEGIPAWQMPLFEIDDPGSVLIAGYEWDERSLREEVENATNSFRVAIDGRLRFVSGAWYV